MRHQFRERLHRQGCLRSLCFRHMPYGCHGGLLLIHFFEAGLGESAPRVATALSGASVRRLWGRRAGSALAD